MILCALAGSAQELTITTFAGPQELPGVTDGIGTAARFGKPAGLAVDRTGNVYVADEKTHSIRKVSPSGAVTTLAGQFYMPGSDDGSNVQARLYRPLGVAIDDAGIVYVADTSTNSIRRVTPAGEVTTVAGDIFRGSADGKGRAAGFYHPGALAIGKDGMIYVADTLNHTIRKMSPDGTVTTIAGSPGESGAKNGVGSAARFYLPNGIAVDEAGNLFVVETWSQTIRKITPTGTVSTFCGAYDQGGAINGPCSVARFNYPVGIAIDQHGDIFVADTYNYCVRKITPEGQVTTVAGVPGQPDAIDGPLSRARLDRPRGIAIDASGAIYVSEEYDATIRKISDGQVTTIAGLAVWPTRANRNGTGTYARFNYPVGIAPDSSGNLYVSDRDNYTIRKITPEAEVTTLAGRPGIEGYADGTGGSAMFAAPKGVACDAAGNIFVADAQSNTIRKITPTGVVTTLAGLGGVVSVPGSADGQGSAARFNFPWGLAADKVGNLYVTDSRNHAIRKVTPAGIVTTMAGRAGAAGTADGIGAAARFNEPHGVAADEAGNVYVADTENHTIRRISPEGSVTTIAGKAGQYGHADGPGTDARFWRPGALALDRDGTILVADTFNYTIRRIDGAGVVTTVAGLATDVDFGFLGGLGTADGTGGEAQFYSPGGIAVDPAGRVFIADSGNSTIRLGRPVIADLATGTIVGEPPQIVHLETTSSEATAWTWSIMRRPPDSRANVSDEAVRNPTFRPDKPGLYMFRLTASGPAGARISYLALGVPEIPSEGGRRRAVRH